MKKFILTIIFSIFCFSCFSQETRKYFTLVPNNPYYSLITFNKVDSITTLTVTINSEIRTNMGISDRNYEDGELLGHSIMDIFTITDSLQINSSGDRVLKIIPSSTGSGSHEICFTPSTVNNREFVKLCFKTLGPSNIWGEVGIITITVEGGIYGEDYWFMNNYPDSIPVAPIGGGSRDRYNIQLKKLGEIKENR